MTHSFPRNFRWTEKSFLANPPGLRTHICETKLLFDPNSSGSGSMANLNLWGPLPPILNGSTTTTRLYWCSKFVLFCWPEKIILYFSSLIIGIRCVYFTVFIISSFWRLILEEFIHDCYQRRIALFHCSSVLASLSYSCSFRSFLSSVICLSFHLSFSGSTLASHSCFLYDRSEWHLFIKLK